MQLDQIKRRDFITLLGGAAAAWPLAARAQQGNQVRSIGVLLAATADASEYQARLGAFQQELQKFGWSIGRNLRIHIRWAGINADDIRRHAAELVALAPDVVLAHGVSTVTPLRQATRTVPIVFPPEEAKRAQETRLSAPFFPSPARKEQLTTAIQMCSAAFA
jgi:ABC-type uncharacterized transport system substrate-binding protein